MNKLMKVVAASVCAVSLSAFADATEEQEVQKEESAVFEAGFDLDFFSAYVWRHAIQTDEMVMQPCVWADLTCLDPFWLGFYIWQNYSLTDRRRSVFKHGLDETDYNVHVGVTAWSNDAEDESDEMSLDFELGHEWYTFNGVRGDARADFCDTREIYLKATFNNPFVNPYVQASWMYDDFGNYESGAYYELGLNREFALCEALTLGADWSLGFADSNYTSYLYGSSSYGFGGTTLKLYLNWAVTDWMTLGGTVAYTGVLNGTVRDDLDMEGGYWDDGDRYQRDFAWGGVSLKLAF